MATIAKQALEVIADKDGAYRTYKEAAAQSFKRGELVQLSGGKVAALAGTDPAANSILGIANADASGVTDSDVIVFVPSPDSLLVANLGVAQTTALAQIGEEYELVEESDKVHVDTSAQVATRVVVVGLDTRDKVGDTNGRVIFKFMAAALDLSA